MCKVCNSVRFNWWILLNCSQSFSLLGLTLLHDCDVSKLPWWPLELFVTISTSVRYLFAPCTLINHFIETKLSNSMCRHVITLKAWRVALLWSIWGGNILLQYHICHKIFVFHIHIHMEEQNGYRYKLQT